ncbi:MAG TPA: O-antigen ligase family protein [Clostridia bacterium]|nr:O-antigen ligase family protein [Clostridia bacterium]
MKKFIISGIIALISISSLFRGLFFSYDTYAFLAGIALLSALYFIAKLLGNETVYLNKPVILCGVILVCAASLGFINALNPRANLDTVILYAELTVVSVILFDFFHDKKQVFIKWLMIPVLAAGFVSSVVGLTALSGFSIWEVTTTYNRIGSTFQYANAAAVYFVICLLFAVTLAGAIDNILLKALFSGMGSVIILALFMTGSRGGYMVGMVVIILMLVLQPHGHRFMRIVGFICMLAPVFLVMRGFNSNTGSGNTAGTVLWLTILFLAAAVTSLLFNLIFKLALKTDEYVVPRGASYLIAAASVIVIISAIVFRDKLIQFLPTLLVERMENLVKLGFNDTNVAYRINYDRDALKLIPGYWLFGAGGGGWNATYQRVQDFFYTAAFVHNNYLQVFLESGVLGFVSFLALVVISLVNSIRFYIKAVNPRLKTFCAGLFCTLLALLVHSAADFDLSYGSLLLLLWAMFTASAVALPPKVALSPADDLPVASDTKVRKGKGIISGKYALTALVIVCSGLMSVNALYFTAAQNARTAFDYAQERDYRMSLAYYEEAGRLDPGNTKYSFEKAKIYRYLANKSNAETTRIALLKKAREASERSVAGNRHYPAYINTLVRIYLDLGMPFDALNSSQELIPNQKYFAENYELLARSYLAAADYYMKDGNSEKAKLLLDKCMAIDADPYLRRSTIDMPNELNSPETISKYVHSENLSKYLKEAETKLNNMN